MLSSFRKCLINYTGLMAKSPTFGNIASFPTTSSQQFALFHCSRPAFGFEEFMEPKKANEIVSAGRSWKAAELRRKVMTLFYNFVLRLILMKMLYIIFTRVLMIYTNCGSFFTKNETYFLARKQNDRDSSDLLVLMTN